MKEELPKHLTALERELARLSKGEPLNEARLAQLLHEVEERLHDSTPAPESAAPEGLLDSLKHWAEHLELEHPTLATVLNRLMLTLGNSGI